MTHFRSGLFLWDFFLQFIPVHLLKKMYNYKKSDKNLNLQKKIGKNGKFLQFISDRIFFLHCKLIKAK